MKNIKLSQSDLERLWILAANEAEYNSKKEVKNKKYILNFQINYIKQIIKN